MADLHSEKISNHSELDVKAKAMSTELESECHGSVISYGLDLLSNHYTYYVFIHDILSICGMNCLVSVDGWSMRTNYHLCIPFEMAFELRKVLSYL